MGLLDGFKAGVAKQLGHPSGVPGKIIGALLNRGNAKPVTGAVDALRLTGGETVADFGFGGGIGLKLLLAKVGPDGTVHGADISETMLDSARSRHRGDARLKLHSASLTELPLPDASLDGAITCNTIYFIEDVTAAFREIARVLKDGGKIVVGIGDPEGMRKQGFTEQGFRIREADEVIGLLADAGLTLDERVRVPTGRFPFHLLACVKKH
ncbi:class I SAM-dependent methyltransferase [Amycolatopsis sp. NPDC059657]|uniref:class I SAM-dependent methyltransferase n=1 Tax=Amycolatopsis sp. NPDC059657 TaxID=3346899 RepID=UPI00366E74A0